MRQKIEDTQQPAAALAGAPPLILERNPNSGVSCANHHFVWQICIIAADGATSCRTLNSFHFATIFGSKWILQSSLVDGFKEPSSDNRCWLQFYDLIGHECPWDSALFGNDAEILLFAHRFIRNIWMQVKSCGISDIQVYSVVLWMFVCSWKSFCIHRTRNRHPHTTYSIL